jgi:G3E family GTPase
MSFARRLVSLCLTLAFASYGFIAAAPAHAHEHHDNAGYAIHAVALDVGHDDHHDHHDQDHAEALDHHDDGPDNDTVPAEHDGVHVHAVASFTTVSGSSAIPELISTAVLNRTEQSIVRVSGLFAPLKKPPRIFL